MTQVAEQDVNTLHIERQVDIAATPERVFAAILAELGPEGQMPDGSAFPMVIEPWPGGRWFRDLGNNAGHWWGQVQVIKPPTLIEIAGPMFMSYPAISHLQYRVVVSTAGSRLMLTHRAMGFITAEHREGVSHGWEFSLTRVRELAENDT
jgi:uncharacterized protein YndB with AHSA1/START domain